MKKLNLWIRIKHYNFEHLVPLNFLDTISSIFTGENASTKAFAKKIATKHNWENWFAMHAINEYKKFIYLGVISPTQITPSKLIDVVWHEHILFTKAYRDFCLQIIEQDFDHYPELLPTAEQTALYKAQYDATLKLYKKEFGIEAPDNIWETTKFNKENKSTAKPKQREKENEYTLEGDLHVSYSHLESFGPTESPEFFKGGSSGGGGASGDWGDGGFGESSDSGDGGGCSSGCGGGCGGD